MIDWLNTQFFPWLVTCFMLLCGVSSSLDVLDKKKSGRKDR